MGTLISFNYLNHRGVDELRTVDPLHIVFEQNPFYGPDPVWILRALCCSRDEMRDFKLDKCRWVT